MTSIATSVLKNVLITFCLTHGSTSFVLYRLKITNKISFVETGKKSAVQENFFVLSSTEYEV